METSVSRRCLQQRTAQMLERSQSLLQYYNNIASLQDWYSTNHGTHTHDDEPMMDLVTGLQTRRHEHRQKEESSGKLVAQKQTIVSVDRECRDGCAKLSETREWRTSLGTSHDERVMTARARSKAMARSRGMARCSAIFCELADANLEFGENFSRST